MRKNLCKIELKNSIKELANEHQGDIEKINLHAQDANKRSGRCGLSIPDTPEYQIKSGTWDQERRLEPL